VADAMRLLEAASPVAPACQVSRPALRKEPVPLSGGQHSVPTFARRDGRQATREPSRRPPEQATRRRKRGDVWRHAAARLACPRATAPVRIDRDESEAPEVNAKPQRNRQDPRAMTAQIEAQSGSAKTGAGSGRNHRLSDTKSARAPSPTPPDGRPAPDWHATPGMGVDQNVGVDQDQSKLSPSA
jgi:hypothetical protein